MGILSKVVKPSQKVEESKDVVGGGGFVLPSDVYPATIKLAMLVQAKSGAIALEVHLETDDKKRIREQLYFVSKEGKTTFERDGKLHHLPAYTTLDDMIRVATECAGTLADIIDAGDDATEKVTVKLYDFDAKKEVPTEVDAITELHGKRVAVALLERKENKQKLNESTGNYEDSGDTREVNVIAKILDVGTGLTANEMAAGKTEPDFKNAWLDKWKDKVDDRSKSTGTAAKSGSPATSGGAKKLFGKK